MNDIKPSSFSVSPIVAVLAFMFAVGVVATLLRPVFEPSSRVPDPELIGSEDKLKAMAKVEIEKVLHPHKKVAIHSHTFIFKVQEGRYCVCGKVDVPSEQGVITTKNWYVAFDKHLESGTWTKSEFIGVYTSEERRR